MQRKGRGRPAIGQAEMIWGRVSTDAKQQIDSLAAQLDIPKARVVAALLEVGLANIECAKFPPSTASRRQQEELPLNRAS